MPTFFKFIAATTKAFALLTLVLSSINTFASELTAEVDRNNVSTDETLTLTIRYTGNRNDHVDISELRNEFDIVSNYENNSYSIVNGRLSGFKEWTFVMRPKREGTLLIPSFRIGRNISDAIEIKVNKPVYQPSQTGQDVFIETIVDKSTAFVQEQIIVKYRLYYSVNIDFQHVDDLKIENAILEQLENTQYQTKLDNRPYNVVEFNYAVFPQASGSISVPALNWNIRAARTRSGYSQGMGRYELKRLRTEEKPIVVKPQPASFPAGATWLPASELTLDETWSANTSNLTAGNPITRTLALKSKGLMAAQLPQIVQNANSSAISIYPEAPNTSENKGALGITSQRIESMALVMNQAGEQVIPAVRIPWWDTNEDKLKYAEIPEQKVTIASSAALEKEERNKAIASQELLTPNQSAPTGATLVWLRLWQAWAILATIVSIIFFVLWRKATAPAPAAHTPTANHQLTRGAQAFSMLKKYCRENNPQLTRQQLILWAAQHWKQNPPKTLDELAARCNNPNLTGQLKLLDEILYKKEANTDWNGQVLLNALNEWLKSQAAQLSTNGNGLAPLYPN
ncbi:conserved hypothetical protein [Saccharophagus degradans 2-40]|uniref:DUF7939 domain-containing protein n=2 Tax=Saccharophagus degradans TaxID=86304 RepID=Q21JX7_SACD2|nr:conserved hypothetical protein [Saccharophagus degradans 2-40]